MNRKMQYVLSHPDGTIATVECTCCQNDSDESLLEQWGPERICGVFKREVDKLEQAGYRLSNWHPIRSDRDVTDEISVTVYGWQPVRVIQFSGDDLIDPSEQSIEELKRHPHQPDDGSWWEHDGNGIPLCRVCDKCRNAKLSRFRPEILEPYNQSQVDEPIEPQ